MRAKILQYERGLSKLDNLERLYKDMKLQLETYKAEQTRLKKENTMYEGELQNLRDEIMDMRYKAEQERQKKEGEEGLRDTYYRKKEIRGLRMSQIGDPENAEEDFLPLEIE